MKSTLPLFFLLVLLFGCGPSQQFVAVPATINKEQVPRQVIDMTAEHFHFTPEELHVSAGTLVTLKITAIDGTHGFKLGAFGIKEKIEEDETKVIEFYAGEKGEYGFRCSHLCGIGHFWMTGKVVIE